MKFYTEGEIIKHLRERFEATDTKQTQVAAKLGFSVRYIQAVLGGARPCTDQMASSLGFRECPRRFTKKGAE